MEITGLYIEGEYAVVITQSGRKYLLDQSLDKVEKQLPEEIFFRLNRKFIINRNSVYGFERAGNGKINILVSAADYFPAIIQVSRTKAPTFKLWFQPEN